MPSARLWSLWDMLERFRTRDLLGALNYVSQTERKIRSELDGWGPATTYNLDWSEERAQLLGQIETLNQIGDTYQLTGVHAALKELRGVLTRGNYNYSALDVNQVRNIHAILLVVTGTIVFILSDTAIYVFTHGAAQYLDWNLGRFPAEIESAFPSARYDYEEASKCRALERWTACVMHCMRALETALLTFAADFLGKPPEKENWHDVLKEIETEIETRKKAGKHKALQFESTAATYFRDIKDGWRNYSMHAKDKFGEEEAIAAYDATRSLLLHLSKRFAEAP